MNAKNLLVGMGFVIAIASGCSSSTQKVEPAQQGDRGESCQARNDCADGLACIGNVCSQNDFPISVTAKQCDLIECQTKDDCCTGNESSYCASLKSACDAGDATSCGDYQTYCGCQEDCKDNRCVVSAACTLDTDCLGSVGSYCVSGQCAQCRTDTDCGSLGHCNAGKCASGCKKNEECQLLETCVSGECKKTGCASDRECYGFTHNPLSKCVDTKCQVPCQNDAECDTFEKCQSGTCVFIGCETDDECRYLLPQFQPQPGTTVSAVCR